MANPYKDLRRELKTLQSKDCKVGKYATPLSLDFTNVFDTPDEPTGHAPIPMLCKIDSDANIVTTTRVRARVQRKRRKGDTTLTTTEASTLYGAKKPIEEWDTEELARGRPRNKNGSFSGPKPQWVSMDLHEEAIDRFARVIKTEMGVATIAAMEQVNEILKNEDTDYRGKPLVSASTKLDAAKFLIEHIVGKPKQHIEQDVSVKLQAILGSVIVNPEHHDTSLSGYTTAHMPGETMELATMEDAANGLYG